MVLSCIYVGFIVLFIGYGAYKRDFSISMGLSLFAALGIRLCWIVTIPIVFHRINVSYTTA